MESTAEYRGYSSGTNTPQGHAIGMDKRGREKRGKRVWQDTDLYGGGKSAPTAFRPRKNDSTMESRPPRDLSRVKCYNYGQLGHVFSSFTKPPKEPGMPLSGKA